MIEKLQLFVDKNMLIPDIIKAIQDMLIKHWLIITAVLVVFALLYSIAKRWNMESSCSRWQEIFGVIARPGILCWAFLAILLAVILPHFGYLGLTCIVVATVMLVPVWLVVQRLNKIYSIKGIEEGITYSQLALLIAFGIWLFTLVWVLQSRDNETLSMILSGAGVLLGWIFQDSIKGIVSFFQLRFNNLLRVGDWIEVKSHGVDGIIKRISLTTVTIENWDTTTSSFPIHILQEGHFKNNQKMLEGKTFGRQMLKTFIIDTSWIHSISEEELEKLKGIIAEKKQTGQDYYEYYITHIARPNELNIHLYREYLYHWLMQNSHVSQEPYLIVRWLEQIPEGMPLQIYIYLLDYSFASFEWNQSIIIEHIVESLAWFNLQLYQSVSGYDAGNTNVHLTPTKIANYRKGQKNG